MIEIFVFILGFTIGHFYASKKKEHIQLLNEIEKRQIEDLTFKKLMVQTLTKSEDIDEETQKIINENFEKWLE